MPSSLLVDSSLGAFLRDSTGEMRKRKNATIHFTSDRILPRQPRKKYKACVASKAALVDPVWAEGLTSKVN